MEGWAWIILVGAWIGATIAAMAGLLLLAWAVVGRRRRTPSAPTATAPVRTADINAICWSDTATGPARSVRCECCGYDTRGLRDRTCPECGWSLDNTTDVPRGRRVRAAWAGLASLVLAGLIGLAPGVLRDGVASAIPTPVLAMLLRTATGPDDILLRELAARLDGGSISPSGREALADRCVQIASSDAPEPARIGAATLLVRMDDQAASVQSRAVRAMRSPTPQVRVCMVKVIAAARRGSDSHATPRHEAIETLVRAASEDPDESVRHSAVDALGRLQLPERLAASTFITCMQDSSPRVRTRAVFALYARRMPPQRRGEIPEPFDRLIQAEHDPHPSVREAALWVTARLAEHADAAIMPAAAGLSDPAPELRRFAAEAMQRLGARAAPAFAELMLCLEDDDPGVREAAMGALRLLRS